MDEDFIFSLTLFKTLSISTSPASKFSKPANLFDILT
jgi:hypothetical protein